MIYIGSIAAYFFRLEEKLTMEIEDKESTRGEVTVKLDKNLIERTVGWL